MRSAEVLQEFKRCESNLAQRSSFKPAGWPIVLIIKCCMNPPCTFPFRNKYTNRGRAASNGDGPNAYQGGMPARGTELKTFKSENTWSSMRNVFAAHNEWIMFLTEYCKTKDRSNAPRVIPRFLPTKVGRLLVISLVDILPFEGYLRDTAGITRGSTPYLFANANYTAAIETDYLTDGLKHFTQQFLYAPIGVQEYRHIAITIERDVLRAFPDGAEDEEDEEDNPNDLQANYTAKIWKYRYGIRADMMTGLTSEGPRIFANGSRRRYRFWLGKDTTPTPETVVTTGANKEETNRKRRRIRKVQLEERTAHYRGRKARYGVARTRCDPQPGL